MKSNQKRTPVLFILMMSALFMLQAQTDSVSVDKYLFSLKVGYNIGAYTPIPISEEIRKVESYKITFNPSIELTIWRRLKNRWGCSVGICYENKGMEASALVKNYHLIMKRNEDEMEGYFTGKTKTKTYTYNLVVPINVTYNLAPKWRMNAGIYGAYLLHGEFSGSVSDGYLRHNTPVGIKTDITADNPAIYDLSEDMSKWDMGAQLGFDWNMLSKFYLFADVSMGIFSIFDADFDAISFPIYPLFGTIGVTFEY